MSHVKPNSSPVSDIRVPLNWEILKGKKKEIEWDKLFTSHGPSLKFQNNKWVASLQPILHSHALEFYESLASDLVKHLKIDPKDKENVQKLITTVNDLWTRNRKLSEPLQKSNDQKGQEAILFNAKSESHGWLSNCFRTLIFVPSNSELYMSVENAYQAKQTKALDPTLSSAIAGSSEPIGSMKAAKRAKKKEQLMKEASAESTKKLVHDVDYMKQLITLKFQQNPVLKSLLMKTGSQSLVEHTTNPFWGDASHGEHTQGPGENNLGKLLENERNALG